MTSFLIALTVVFSVLQPDGSYRPETFRNTFVSTVTCHDGLKRTRTDVGALEGFRFESAVCIERVLD